jgi:hypothetical protein
VSAALVSRSFAGFRFPSDVIVLGGALVPARTTEAGRQLGSLGALVEAFRVLDEVYFLLGEGSQPRPLERRRRLLAVQAIRDQREFSGVLPDNWVLVAIVSSPAQLIASVGGIFATVGSGVTIYGFVASNLALVLVGLAVTVAGVYGMVAAACRWWPVRSKTDC